MRGRLGEIHHAAIPDALGVVVLGVVVHDVQVGKAVDTWKVAPWPGVAHNTERVRRITLDIKNHDGITETVSTMSRNTK